MASDNLFFKCEKKVIMRIILTISVLLNVLQPTKSLYIGEYCSAGDVPGTCLRLPDCKALDDEVRRSGNPMPPYMRNKLQALGCGYDFDLPLVCCAISATPATTNVIKPVVQPTSGTTVNSGESETDVEAFTRRSMSDRNGLLDIEGHPNLNLLPESCGNMDGDRIYGGNETALFEMPWMVLLSYSTGRNVRTGCGGTIINDRYILTAAHCLTFLGRSRLSSAILGEHDTTRDPDCEIIDNKQVCAPSITNAAIEATIPHPNYTNNKLTDDIGLIRLSKPISFLSDSIKPICLPMTSELQTKILGNEIGIAAGWGATETTLPSPVLLSVDLPVVSRQDCMNAYNRSVSIGVGQLCAGGVPGKDSCSGDSGGPLMVAGRYGNAGVRYIQHGVVSFGTRQCAIGRPAIYTDVAYYMNWILDNMHS